MSVTAGPDECRFTNIRLAFAGIVGYRMETLLVRGIPLERPPGPLAPVHAHAEARGLTLSLNNLPARLAWLARQQTPFDVTLDASYDPATAAFQLDELSMDGESVGHVGLRARLENVHLTTARANEIPDVQAPPSLRSLHLELDSRTFLAGFTLPMVANLLPDDDSDGVFRAARAQVIAAIRSHLPASGASTETIDALTGLVADYPRPKHPAVIDLEASPAATLDAIAAAAEDPARLAALLRTVRVTASYAGTIR